MRILTWTVPSQAKDFLKPGFAYYVFPESIDETCRATLPMEMVYVTYDIFIDWTPFPKLVSFRNTGSILIYLEIGARYL